MNDILLNSDADLKTNAGDFVTGRSNEQHQEHLLVFQKGALKDKPEIGVGLENYLMGDDVDGMLREARYQFENDGMTVNSIAFDDLLNNLDYDADYKS
jgi:hypothetical protein